MHPKHCSSLHRNRFRAFHPGNGHGSTKGKKATAIEANSIGTGDALARHTVTVTLAASSDTDWQRPVYTATATTSQTARAIAMVLTSSEVVCGDGGGWQ